MVFQMFSPNLHICSVFMRVKAVKIPAGQNNFILKSIPRVLSSLHPSGKHVDVGVEKGLVFFLDEWSTALSFCINSLGCCVYIFKLVCCVLIISFYFWNHYEPYVKLWGGGVLGGSGEGRGGRKWESDKNWRKYNYLKWQFCSWKSCHHTITSLIFYLFSRTLKYNLPFLEGNFRQVNLACISMKVQGCTKWHGCWKT